MKNTAYFTVTVPIRITNVTEEELENSDILNDRVIAELVRLANAEWRVFEIILDEVIEQQPPQDR